MSRGWPAAQIALSNANRLKTAIVRSFYNIARETTPLRLGHNLLPRKHKSAKQEAFRPVETWRIRMRGNLKGRLWLMALAAGAIGVSLAAQGPQAPASPGVANAPDITAKDLSDG